MQHPEWRRTYRCPVCGTESVSLAKKKACVKSHKKQT